MNPELLALLLACKAQMEEDAVKIDGMIGWCRALPALIEQDAMPEAWDRLVAYLAQFAQHNSSDNPQRELVNAARKALNGSKR